MPKKYRFGLAASSVAGQTMQLVGSEDAVTVSKQGFRKILPDFMVELQHSWDNNHKNKLRDSAIYGILIIMIKAFNAPYIPYIQSVSSYKKIIIL